MQESLVDQRYKLEDLLDLQTLRDVIDAFVSCFSLGLLIVDEKQNQLFENIPHEPYCQQIRSALGKEAKCDEVKNKIIQVPITGTSAIQVQAYCGFKYAAFPLIYQFDVIGRVVLGPYRDEDGAGDRKLIPPDNRNNQKIIKAMEAIPVIKPPQLKNITRLLAKSLDAFIFINAKRLVTTHLHLESIMQARERVFEQIEDESSGTPEKKKNLEKLKQMF